MNLNLCLPLLALALVMSACSSPAPAPKEQPVPVAPEAPRAEEDHAHAEDAHDHAEDDHDHAKDDHEHSDDEHDHHHEAPRGGALVELGDHVAHVELLLHSESGKLSLFAMDAHAENPVKLTALEIPIQVTPESGEPLQLVLLPQASTLTGETAGDTSEFGVVDDRLKNVTRFSGVLPKIDIKGVVFENVSISYPEGNQ